MCPGRKFRDFFIKSKYHHLAILINIWHIWEDRSQTINNDEPDFRFFHGNFWPVMSQAVRKPCFWAWIPRGPNFWKPWTCGYVAAGAFFFQKNGPHIFGSPELVGTLPQAPFFFQKNGPWIFGSPKLVGTLPQAPFFSRKMAPHISEGPSWSGPAP